jgi:AraC-like DNA-binding protein
VIELRIAMKKQILGKWEGFKEATIPEDHFCLCYSPTVVTHAEFPDPAFYSTWDIHFDIPFLTSIAKDYPVLQELLNKVDRKEPFQYRAEHYICTPEMKGAIARIMENGHSRASQAWNLTFSAGELLISVLEKIGGPMSKYANLIHNKYLIDRLMNAKTFIESFVTEKEVKPMELKEVYKKCQLNSSNLSYGFRTIFNTTPRRYYEDLRMDLGKKMLRETDHSIGHIALTLDYSNIAHYSDQFRVRFGESPLQYRLRFRKNRNPEDGKG